MKYIAKNNSPQFFEEWKTQWKLTEEDLINNTQLSEQKKSVWEKLSGEIKQNVKLSLLEEQGFICCYCQRKIELDTNTIIEHFIARDIEPIKMFDYDNIFACCDGGDSDREVEKQKGVKKSEKTPLYCDRKKDDNLLKITPLDINCETHFFYRFNYSLDDKPNVEITHLSNDGEEAIRVLNLNNKKLRKMRGDWIAYLIFDENNNLIPEDDIEKLLSIARQKEDGKFLPFCVALEQILQSLQPKQNYVS